MDQSSHLGLPYILPQQAQKHVTHNEAIRMLDALVHLAVLSKTQLAPPEAPVEGDRYIVGDAATGIWAGQDGRIAAWQDGAWAFHVPRAGWRAWIAEDAVLEFWDGTRWRPMAASSSILGINTTADEINRLAVKSQAVLLSHPEEGPGDLRLKLNKESVGDTASLVFQSGYSGRAEFGLAGSDDWSVKVSADGTAWKTAINVDHASGAVSLPQGMHFPGFWRWYHASSLVVSGSGVGIIWDTASHNPEGAYDPLTGKFTAPVAGIYLVNISFCTQDASSLRFHVRVNAQVVAGVQMIAPGGWSHLEKTALVLMQAGDIMDVRVEDGSTLRFDAGGQLDNVTVLRLGRI